MKSLLILFAIFGISINLAFGQSDKEDIEIIQAIYGKEKKDLINAYMTVSSKDSASFWKVYDEYEVKRKALGKERLGLLRKYSESHEGLTGEAAGKIVRGILDNDVRYSNMFQKYYARFSGIVGSIEAARFVYLEYYLQSLIKQYVQENLSDIEEIVEKKEN